MRRLALPLALLVAVYLDSILFCRLNIEGIRPDAILAVVVSAGVLLGSIKGEMCIRDRLVDAFIEEGHDLMAAVLSGSGANVHVVRRSVMES